MLILLLELMIGLDECNSAKCSSRIGIQSKKVEITLFGTFLELEILIMIMEFQMKEF